jgi:hypothetical protein
MTHVRAGEEVGGVTEFAPMRPRNDRHPGTMANVREARSSEGGDSISIRDQETDNPSEGRPRDFSRPGSPHVRKPLVSEPIPTQRILSILASVS